MLESVLGGMLELAIGPKEKTKLQYILACIRETVRWYGPWIHQFAKRVSAGHSLNKEDNALLKKILSEAKSRGYKRSLFESHHQKPRPLYSTLVAFLIEHCSGGGGVWKDINRTPPVELIKKAVAHQRKQGYGDRGGVENLLKEYLGEEWKQIRDQPAPKMPKPIRCLLTR